ncbi:hypothetical protein FOA52_006836 [Chlamydomonas sp. UWO 241]|nr:hypothetical protein FOA52_006836 [Chlamydomonas sp. UWO 241]
MIDVLTGRDPTLGWGSVSSDGCGGGGASSGSVGGGDGIGGGSSGGDACVAGAPRSRDPVAALLELAHWMQATRPWADFSTGHQLTAILSELVDSHSRQCHTRGEARTRETAPQQPVVAPQAFPQGTMSGGTDDAPARAAAHATCVVPAAARGGPVAAAQQQHGAAATTAARGGTAEVPASARGGSSSSSSGRGSSGLAAGAAIDREGYTRFGNLVIPFGGLAGITLFARRGTIAHRWLAAEGALPPTDPSQPQPPPRLEDEGSCVGAGPAGGAIGAEGIAGEPQPPRSAAAASRRVCMDVALPLYGGALARVHLDMAPL